MNVLDTGVPPGGDGGGPPLLFVHGWSSNWQIFLLNIAAFMDTHRCLAIDLPGFGASEMPAEPITIKGYARTVDAMCDALDEQGAALPVLTRRDDEDRISREVYTSLPYPENQLVALAHSLVTRDVIDETELADRLDAVRARLDAGGA